MIKFTLSGSSPKWQFLYDLLPTFNLNSQMVCLESGSLPVISLDFLLNFEYIKYLQIGRVKKAKKKLLKLLGKGNYYCLEINSRKLGNGTLQPVPSKNHIC
jgi:hypothetical protein